MRPSVMLWINIVAIVVMAYASNVRARPHSSHKVHSLLLYPNKHAWCETKDIEMVITHPDCESITFSNKVCVGQCFSYATPRTNPPNQIEEKLKYCDQCKPSNTTWKQVTLQCQKSLKYKTFMKEVELIHECNCQSCNPEPMVTQETEQEYEALDPNQDYEEDEDTSRVNYGVDANGNVMSREQYLELARHRLESEYQGVIASHEVVEQNKKHGRNWIENRYKNIARQRV